MQDFLSGNLAGSLTAEGSGLIGNHRLVSQPDLLTMVKSDQSYTGPDAVGMGLVSITRNSLCEARSFFSWKIC